MISRRATIRPCSELTVRSLGSFDKFVARVSSVSGLPVTYRRTGTLEIATEEESLPVSSSSASRSPRRGITAEVVDAAAVRREEPPACRWCAGRRLLIPARICRRRRAQRALAAAARRHGAQLIEHGRVKRIAEQEGELSQSKPNGDRSPATVSSSPPEAGADGSRSRRRHGATACQPAGARTAAASRVERCAAAPRDLGVSAVISCPGKTGRCSSAPRLKRRASTSERPRRESMT